MTLRDRAGLLNGRTFIVEDTMNVRMANTVDIWMGSRAEALPALGLTHRHHHGHSLKAEKACSQKTFRNLMRKRRASEVISHLWASWYSSAWITSPS